MKYATQAVLIATTLFVFSLYGCGTKGPLYLPDQPDKTSEEAAD